MYVGLFINIDFGVFVGFEYDFGGVGRIGYFVVGEVELEMVGCRIVDDMMLKVYWVRKDLGKGVVYNRRWVML